MSGETTAAATETTSAAATGAAGTAVATIAEPRTDSSFELALVAERDAERTVMRAVIRGIALGIPIGIAFFIGLLAIAVGDQLEWWVIFGVGVSLGIVAAVLFGMLGGVTLTAHAFDEVDRGEPLHS